MAGGAPVDTPCARAPARGCRACPAAVLPLPVHLGEAARHGHLPLLHKERGTHLALYLYGFGIHGPCMGHLKVAH